MTDQEFRVFLQEAVTELQIKQDALLSSDYGFGSFSRWWYEQENETLQFFTKEGSLGLETDTINIGSYESEARTWKWAWANSFVLSHLRAKAEVLKELESMTGYALFGNEEAFEIDDRMSWELAAVAVKHLGALGCYRAPMSNGLHVFLAIMSVKHVYH